MVDSTSFSIAARFEQFARVDCRGYSVLYECVAKAVAHDEAALAVIAEAPVDTQHPTIVLAVVHDLALAGATPAVADAFAARDGQAAGAAVCAAIVAHRDALLKAVGERQTQTNEVGRCALLYPAVAHSAAVLGAGKVALVDVGCSAGLNLQLERYAIAYSDGVRVGERRSPVQLSCEVKGATAPPRPDSLPVIVERVGIDLRPVDVSDAAEARWLEACLWPDQPERRARLRAAFEIAAEHPPRLVEGNVLDKLVDVIADLPSACLPVVTTTWAIAYLKPSDRFRFLHRLNEAARERPVAWVSAESVGLAPSVPTLGDPKGSAHSLLAVAVGEGRTWQVETVARCQPHGQWIEWLAP